MSVICFTEDARQERKFLRDMESGIESETDSGNETISSENVDMSGGWPETQLDFALPKVAEEIPGISSKEGDMDDIDAFIASVTVPPPPKDSPEDLPPPPVHTGRQNSTKRSVSTGSDDVFPPPPDSDDICETVEIPDPEGEPWEHLVAVAPPLDGALEEEYAKYVIPPPPSCEETALLGDIVIVPPVSIKTPVSDKGSPTLEFIQKRNNRRVEMRRSPPENGVLRAVVRPVQSLKDENRYGPPLPPKRISSVESTSCRASPSEPSAKLANLWWHSDIRSADSSPVHRGKDLREALGGSTGTLNRRRGGVPPPPPPRRSSMQHLAESPVHSRSSSIDSQDKSPSPTYATPISALTSQFRKETLDAPHHKHSNYVNVYQSQSNSEPALCKIDQPSPQSDTSSTGSYGQIFAKLNSTSSFTKTNSAQDLNKGAQSTHNSTPDDSTSAIVIDEMLKKMSKNVEESCSEPPCTDSTESKLTPRHRSPSFTRKLLTFEIGRKDSESDTGESDIPASPKTLGRSNTFTNTPPKSYGSPKSSPLLQRHGSFGKLAERAASPLRSFLFGGSDRDRTSSESESGSCPASPRRSLRSSIASTFQRSSLSKPFGSGSQVSLEAMS